MHESMKYTKSGRLKSLEGALKVFRSSKMSQNAGTHMGSFHIYYKKK